MDFNDEFGAFYEKCLAELKGRADFTEAYIPMLERYVFITMKAAKLGCDIAEAEVTVSHTNKADKTNEVTSPRWRMFLLLDKQSSALARELRLSPVNAPKMSEKKPEKKSFDTKMKALKTA